MSDLDRAKTKMARWRILRILYSGRPYPVGEGLIVDVLIDADLQMTPTQVRNALQYLCDKKLIELKQARNDDGKHWEARLLADGVDFVDGFGEPIDGIARPSDY